MDRVNLRRHREGELPAADIHDRIARDRQIQKRYSENGGAAKDTRAVGFHLGSEPTIGVFVVGATARAHSRPESVGTWDSVSSEYVASQCIISTRRNSHRQMPTVAGPPERNGTRISYESGRSARQSSLIRATTRQSALVAGPSGYATKKIEPDPPSQSASRYGCRRTVRKHQLPGEVDIQLEGETILRQKLVSISPYSVGERSGHAGGALANAWYDALRDEFDVSTIAFSRTRIIHETLDGDVLSELTVKAERMSHIDTVRSALGPPLPVVQALTDSLNFTAVLATADIIELQWPSSLGLSRYTMAKVGKERLAYIAHDLRTQALTSQSVQIRAPRAAARAVARLPLAFAHETRALRRMGTIWTLKDADRTTAQRMAGAESFVGSITPPPFVAPNYARDQRRRPQVVGFVGDIDKLENQVALDWFVSAVWPSVLAAEPRAQLRIIGRNTNTKRYASVPGVEQSGWVEDLAAEYDKIVVSVAPMKIRGGKKFKVAEALAHQVPVIASSIAAEGYSASELNGVSIASDKQSWVEQVTRTIATSGDGYIDSDIRHEATRQLATHQASMENVIRRYKTMCAR